jgi:2,4-dienoyl-CoA reductase (NADPH2)
MMMMIRAGAVKKLKTTSPRRGQILRFRSCSSKPFSTAAAVTSDEEASSSSLDLHPLYPHLFQPLTLNNGTVLANRALMGSMHTGLEGSSIPKPLEWYLNRDETEPEDHSLQRMATYFQERAQGGVGLMVTGGIAPNAAGWVAPFAAKLSTEQEMEHHKVVTEAVHSVSIPIYGSNKTGKTTTPKICLQLLHAGRYSYTPLAVSASATKSPISPFPAKELSKKGIQQTVADFTHTAVLAQQAGYDGVEIMGSEGYLLTQFLVPRTNHRTDEYGGSFENRVRYVHTYNILLCYSSSDYDSY